MKWIAALFWTCFAWAGCAYLAGDRSAMTGVVGAGIMAVACAILWVIESPS